MEPDKVVIQLKLKPLCTLFRISAWGMASSTFGTQSWQTAMDLVWNREVLQLDRASATLDGVTVKLPAYTYEFQMRDASL
jgi:hypothetical protein